MKSFSEIETITKRATRAAGFSWGIAEEVAKGIRLLELFGFPGIRNLNQYYKIKNKDNFEKLNLINQNNRANNFAFCPIILGVSFMDQIRTLDTFEKITFKEIAYPVLFIPFLSRGSEIIGKKILLDFEGNQFLLNLNINIYSNFLQKDFPSIAKNVEVTFLDNKDNFTDDEWKSLYKLSEKTFVEESDSLKKGAAGAGLTDND